MLMKKISILSLLIFVATTVAAQNVQLHYDLGHTLYNDLSGRPNVTTTVEMFKLDKLGSTFLFTDIDYYGDGAAGAYWEIAREFKLGKNSPFAVHVEYNGGMTSIEDTPVANRFQHAALLGGAWNWASKDFNTTLSLQAMYKYYFKGQNRGGFNGFQLTTVWATNFFKKAVTFSGFADLWYDKDVNGKLIFITEPQLWYNINTLKGCKGVNLSLGTEVEISNNFVFNTRGESNRFYAIPTLAAKWTF